MEQPEINQLVGQAEDELIRLSEILSELKQALGVLSEENNRLRMTNHHLKALLQEQTSPAVQEPVAPFETSQDDNISLESRVRLQTFYDEGIHVCHPFFGSRRLSGEECMFCQGIIDGSGR